jgi:hypothetical protein
MDSKTGKINGIEVKQITHFSMEIKGNGTRVVNILSYVTTFGNATFMQMR